MYNSADIQKMMPAFLRSFAVLAAAIALSSCTAAVSEPTPVLGSDVNLPAEVHIIAARVARGATLASLLRAHDVAEREVAALVARAAAVFDLRLVRADQPYRIAQSIGGELRRFEYEIDRDRILRVARRRGDEAEAFVAEIGVIPKTSRFAVIRGAIDQGASSLFAAMDRAGEEVELSLALADVFSGDVDFNTELQPGDRFELVVEKRYRADATPSLVPDGDAFAGYGPVVAATLENDGRTLHAVRFTPEGGTPGYFDEQGRSRRRFFLRSPLPFDPVITSRFSRNRRHPVLGVHLAHLGVDYRAPAGSPVVAVADGVVVSAGVNGGAGRMVHLRHPNGFETQYLHLSSIAVRQGTRVGQGELIGRVGSTGLATGPHLDYRLRKNGVFVNPVTAHRLMPPGDPVPEGQMPAFIVVRDRVLAALSSGSPVGLNADDD
jgi:murein DD-endopeptidase MepM/ murein hydrolase activator NlpD